MERVKKDRPVGIVILGALEVLGGAFFLVLGVRFALSFFGGSGPFGEILGLVYLPLGVSAMALSLFISRRRRRGAHAWTWQAAMVLAVCSVALSAVLLNFISIMINGIIIYVLCKPAARAFLKS